MMVQVSTLLVGSELTPLFHFTPHDCFIWQVYQGASAATIVVAVDTVLILRVDALFHGHRIIRYVVATFFALEVVGMIVGLALALPGITYDHICLVVGVPRTLIIYGASAVIFQVILFSLTLYKFIQAVRSGWGNVPLIKLLMRDGTWAFFLLFTAYIGQIGLYAHSNPSYAGFLYGWLLTAFSFSGYRILINLRDANGPESRTNAAMQFSMQMFDLKQQTDI